MVIHAGEADSLSSIPAKAILQRTYRRTDRDREASGVHWWLFPDLLALDQKAEWLERTTAKRTYDARLSLDVDRRIADNFVYSPGLGKHRHMA